MLKTYCSFFKKKMELQKYPVQQMEREKLVLPVEYKFYYTSKLPWEIMNIKIFLISINNV